VFVSIDGGPLVPFLLGTAANTASFTGAAGHTYGFAVAATDNAGNAQPRPILIQATTTVIAPAPTLSIAGPSTATAGSTYTLTLSASGPAASTIESWTVNWGDGLVQTFNGDPTTEIHVYATGKKTYTISSTATTPVGAFSAGDTVAVAVATSSAPAVTLAAPPPAVAGVTFFDQATFRSKSRGPFTATVDYGDGSGTHLMKVSASRPLTLNHVFAVPGTYVVIVGVKDRNHRLGQYETLLTVSSALTSGYGAGPDAFVTTLYTEELRRIPAPQELAFWSKMLAAGAKTKTVARAIYNLPERRAHSPHGPSIAFKTGYAQALQASKVAVSTQPATPSGKTALTHSLRRIPAAARKH
jgi:hypothetical protein